MGRIKETFTYIYSEMFAAIYPAPVRSHLEYPVQAWSPYKWRGVNKLGKVQRRATKLVPELRELPYHERHFICHYYSCGKGDMRGLNVEFKILNGYDVNSTQLFNLSERDLRGDKGTQLKVAKPRYRATKRNNFFYARKINKWASLPESVVSSPIVNILN